MTNRQQRRQGQRKNQPQGQLAMVDLRQITWPWQMDDKLCAIALQDRVVANLLQTKHPLHHRTANGVIIAPDPTTEYFLKRLEGNPAYQDQLAAIKRTATERDQRTDIPQAIPVNRKFYGFDPYERH